MALHAGFAAALSITTDAIQKVVHASYVNNLIPAIQQGTSTITGGTIAFDLVLAEPKVSIPGAGTTVTVHIELLGTMTFSGEGKPTIVNEVIVKADATMSVVMRTTDGALQFGLDGTTPMITNPVLDRLSGADPSAVYGVDTNDDILAFLAITGAIVDSADNFILTPPQLPQLVQLGYGLTMEVNTSPSSLNIGVDVTGLTNGNAANLVDLNRTSTAKGYTKTLSDVQVADEEYGAPIYEPKWSATKKRTTGAHDTAVGVSLNEVMLLDVFKHLGRHAVIAAYEEGKHADVLDRLGSLAGKNWPEAVVAYEPNSDSLTFLNQLNISLGHDHVFISGVGSNFKTLAVHVDFELRARFIRTLFNSNLAATSYDSSSGFTIETYDVEISQPEWVTAIEVIIGVAGVALAPFTAGVSLLIAGLLDMLIAAFVGTYIANAETGLGTGIVEAVSGFQGIIEFTLPDTEGPKFTLKPNDLVVRTDALTAWFGLTQQATAAAIRVVNHSPGDVSWPATNLAAIAVDLVNTTYLYNHHDPKVRIRWRVYTVALGTGGLVPIIKKDVAINTSHATRISIDHASAALQGHTKFIVKCRVYRPWAGSTQELFAQSLTIKIVDKLDRTHPYVHWRHEVHYQGYSAKKGDPTRQPTGWQNEARESQIHRTDAAKRCWFAAGFPSGLEPEYLDELPFPLTASEVNAHRKQICEYCFFGGPDKMVLK